VRDDTEGRSGVVNLLHRDDAGQLAQRSIAARDGANSSCGCLLAQACFVVDVLVGLIARQVVECGDSVRGGPGGGWVVGHRGVSRWGVS